MRKLNILTNTELKTAFALYLLSPDERTKSRYFEFMIPTFDELAELMFIRRHISDVELKDEIKQRAMIQIFRKITELNVHNITNLSGYIRVIVLNELKMFFRGDGRYYKHKDRQKNYTRATHELWQADCPTLADDDDLPQSEHIIVNSW
jgi:DNA-directed RNA polymerase specialized sigma24 family protein